MLLVAPNDGRAQRAFAEEPSSSSEAEAIAPLVDEVEAADGSAPRAEEIDPRTRFNQGNAALADGEALAAAAQFRTARAQAPDDPELRHAATYNLGVAAVARADATLDGEPREALAALQEAADWFREAVAQRPDDEDPRHNLEVVLRRALVLADEIAQAEQGRVEDELDALIEGQRERNAAAARLLEAVGAREEREVIESLRPAFAAEATQTRVQLAEVEALADRVARERESILAMSEETRAPEETLRAAQLDGVVVHLDDALERMGQARRQLRRRSAERAYRRGAAALGELKRARDQLRDPVEQIGVLIEEVATLVRATATLQASAAPALEEGELLPIHRHRGPLREPPTRPAEPR